MNHLSPIIARRAIIACRVCRCITAALVAVLFLAASCTTDGLPIDAPSTPVTPAADTISADSLGTFELTLSGQRASRATTTTITKDEADNFLVTIYKGSDIVRTATRLKDVNTSLPAGYGYRIMAENCTEHEAITVNDGWGQKRFAGFSASFAIKAGQTTAVNVGCSVANAAVAVVFDESVAEYFTTSYDITITDGDRTIVFDATTAGKRVGDQVTEGRTAYFNLDADGQHQLTYTIHAVGPKELTKTGTLDLSQAKTERITLDYERSYFDFVLTLDSEEMFVDEIINITDADIVSDQGNTEFTATHQPFTAASPATHLNAPSRHPAASPASSSTPSTPAAVCPTVSPSDSPSSPSSFPASSPSTRAALGSDGLVINWESGDAVAVYDYRSARHSFPAADISGDRAKFSGLVAAKSQTFAAIYPYSLAAETATSPASLSATLPTTQHAVAGNIASTVNISVAKGERNLDGSPASVTFYNATQLLRFSVPAYAENRIRSILLTANTPVAGKLNIDYSGDTPSTTIASTESKTITILPPNRVSTFEAGTYYIAAAPVQLASFTLSYTCDGKTYSQASTAATGGQASHIYELGSIDLINTPSASATHVYSDGILQGTRLAVTGAPIEGREWTATVLNSSNAIVRTLTGTGDLASDQSDASWPYLPKGNYTLNYTFTDSNGENRTASTTFNVPASTLSLTVDGYSAHTKYEAGDITAANACDRLTFYAPSARLSVAPSLMSNANYTRTFTRSCNGQNATTTESTNAPSWANYSNVPVSGSLYTFSVTANFAGETVSASKTFRITGLPANFTPPTKATGWANDKGTTEFNSDHVRLGNASFSQPHRIKNSSWFNIPSGTRMSLDYDLALHKAAVTTTANVKAGGQTIVTCSDVKGYTDVHNTGVQLFTTSENVTSVTCEGSYGSGATHTKVYKLFFQYSK